MGIRRVYFLLLGTSLGFSLGLAVYNYTYVRHLEGLLYSPHPIKRSQLLYPDRQRCPDDVSPAVSQDEEIMLTLPLIAQPAFADYRLDIIDRSSVPPRLLWRSAGITRHEDDYIAVLLPKGYLPKGTYRLVVYGLGKGLPERLEGYGVKVSTSSSVGTPTPCSASWWTR